MKKKLYLLNEKKEFVPSSEKKYPKSGIFINNYWAKSGKVILQASIAVFPALSKWLSPLEKNGPHAYVYDRLCQQQLQDYLLCYLHTTQFFFNLVGSSLDVQLSNVHLDYNFIDVRLRLQRQTV